MVLASGARPACASSFCFHSAVRWCSILGLVAMATVVHWQVKPIFLRRTAWPVCQALFQTPMPFTPLHLGPGLAFKALGGHRFSCMVFGGSQVLMDIELLIGILQNKAILHGYTHTLLGALVIGTVAGVVGKPISACVLRLLSIPHLPFSWGASFAGAYMGTFSHVLLDALMHSDMVPWWPIASGNPLLGAIGLGQLHVACLAAGVAGALALAFKAKSKARARASAKA